MRKSNYGVLGFMLSAVIAVLCATPTYAGEEIFVVSSSLNGDANYLSSRGDGTFFSQEILRKIRDTQIDVPYKFSYGNGLGDFDNDGDLDYIMAIGFGSGNIYIFEKIGTANQFADPYLVGTWGQVEGRFAMDFAVADYDGDGNMDFVLSLGDSTACGLYLGDGQFGFKSRPLPNTATAYSTGADAADFNNDENADFVIASGNDEPFYVSLGNGKGNFTTFTFDSHDGGPVYGVAAADFTGDGIADIAAAYTDYLYVYQGAGDGKTFTLLNSYELPVNEWSAIDNYDFNGDGKQDLVLANYADDPAGVAVFLGNGDGSFRYSDIYGGGAVQERNAITGPPFEPVRNIGPVAVIEPAFLEVTAGEEIHFDGSNSFDEDGQIISYEWDFGAAGTIADAGSASPVRQAASDHRVKGISASHTYFASGKYVVTLWVTDDQGATADIQAEVLVKPVQARIKFYPFSLYIDSKGKYLWAKISFPSGFDARKVDESGVCLIPDDTTAIFTHQKRKNNFFDRVVNRFCKRRKSITVRFDRQAVLATLACPPAPKTELRIQGEIYDNDRWVEFEGSGTIWTKMRRRHQCNAGRDSGEQAYSLF